MKIKNSLSETLNLCAFAPLRETNSYFHSPTPVFVSRNLAERSHRVGAKKQRKKGGREEGGKEGRDGREGEAGQIEPKRSKKTLGGCTIIQRGGQVVAPQSFPCESISFHSQPDGP